MEPMSLDKAISIALTAHKGQKDKRGDSYIRHPLRVMEMVGQEDTGSEDEMIVAVLHDVVEDSPKPYEETLALLEQEGCTYGQLAALRALSRNSNENYFDFIDRIQYSVVARKVKIADLKDNLALWRMRGRREMSLDDQGRVSKYMKALARLEGF